MLSPALTGYRCFLIGCLFCLSRNVLETRLHHPESTRCGGCRPPTTPRAPLSSLLSSAPLQTKTDASIRAVSSFLLLSILRPRPPWSSFCLHCLCVCFGGLAKLLLTACHALLIWGCFVMSRRSYMTFSLLFLFFMDVSLEAIGCWAQDEGVWVLQSLLRLGETTVFQVGFDLNR